MERFKYKRIHTKRGCIAYSGYVDARRQEAQRQKEQAFFHAKEVQERREEVEEARRERLLRHSSADA